MASADPQVCLSESTAVGLCQRRYSTHSRGTEEERGSINEVFLFFGHKHHDTALFSVFVKDKLTWRVREVVGR